jgi:hypothetical protein
MRPRIVPTRRAAIASLVCSISVTIQVATQADGAVGVRNAHGLAYDARRGEVILLGGANDRSVLAGVWSWDGKAWRRLGREGPLPRTFPATAADPNRKTVYVFGGHRALFGSGQPRDTVLSDFWRWDGARWSALDGTGPGPRAEASMAFDHARNRVILFGGYRGTGAQRVRLGDTWEWDGATWSLVSTTGPTPRNNAAIVYDSDRRVAVLFGGSDGSASGETWEWNGRSWVRSGAPTVEARYNPAMVYDPVRRRTVRFGGWNGRERTGDTWLYDGHAWTRQSVGGPAPRNHAALAFDMRRGRAVLFGGHDGSRVFGDTWEWLGDRWAFIDSVPSRMRVDNGH